MIYAGRRTLYVSLVVMGTRWGFTMVCILVLSGWRMLCFIAIYSRVLLQETQVVFSIFTYQLIRIAKPGFRNLFEKKG